MTRHKAEHLGIFAALFICGMGNVWVRGIEPSLIAVAVYAFGVLGIADTVSDLRHARRQDA